MSIFRLSQQQVELHRRFMGLVLRRANTSECDKEEAKNNQK
ncbi:MAG: hypothetical protein Q7S59_09095 [Sulfurimonas sp.]|nr:hypothetical protein [Sulfurimonas sp.]